MKTISQPAVITPSIIALALLAVAVVFVGATEKKVPLLSNVRVDIILLGIIGMAICAQGGIGRIATRRSNSASASLSRSRASSSDAFLWSVCGSAGLSEIERVSFSSA